MQRVILIFSLSLIPLLGVCQDQKETLSLDEAIQIALKKNLDLQSSKLSSDEAGVNFKESRSDLLPNLNGNYSVGINNGRSIDPYSNSYIDQRLTFSNAGLLLSATVFNGFRLMNTLKRDRLNMKAAAAETEAAQQELILNVTLAYLQVLNNKDLVELAKARRESTKGQVSRLKSLYDEGKGNPADYTDIKGQLSNDKASLIEAQKNLAASRLKLEQLLNVDYAILPKAMILPENFDKYGFSSQQVFEDALNNLATFKAKSLRLKAAEKDISVSRALYIPTISFFAQLNTNYSSLARTYTQIGTEQVESGGVVTINNQTYPVVTPQAQFAENRISYFDQLNSNLNSVVGIQVDIPIFNGFKAKHQVQLKKIKLKESQVDYDNTKSKFKEAIKEAYADMEASYQQIYILEDQVNAYQESYRVNEIRFNSGVSNIVEYIISKNNLENAQINLKNTKYDYLLRVKILDYYRGNI